MIVGVNLCPRRIDYTPVWYQEVDLLGCIGHGAETLEGQNTTTFDVVAEMFRRAKGKTAELITHRFPLDRFPEAIATAWGKGRTGAVKVAFEFR